MAIRPSAAEGGAFPTASDRCMMANVDGQHKTAGLDAGLDAADRTDVKVMSLDERLAWMEKYGWDTSQFKLAIAEISDKIECTTVQDIMLDMDSVGIPRQIADLPPAGWKPFARQKPFISYAPDEEGVVYVCGVYGSTNWVDSDEMTSVFDAFSQEADKLVETGHVQEGLRKLEVVLEHFQSTGNDDGQIRTLQQMGIIQLQSRDAKAATTSLSEAASILDRVHSRLIPAHHSEPAGSRFEIPVVDRKLDVARRAVFEHDAPLYGWLIAALVEQGNIQEAFLISEKSKARAISQLRRGASSNAESWEAYSQTAASERAVVLEYAFTPSPLPNGRQQLVVWVLSHSGALLGHNIIVYNGGESDGPQEDVRSRLSTLLQGLRSALGVTRGKVKEKWISQEERQLASQKKILKEMFDILILPVQKWLHSCTSVGADDLLIVPHLILNEIPWSALMDKDGSHLVEMCSVRLAPSLKTLDILRSGITGCQEHDRCAFIAGNPSPTSRELKMEDLEWADREARAVEGFFITQLGTWKVDAVYGAGATKEVVKRGLACCDWIHLACHSMMEEQALILASTEEDDGVTRMGTLQEAFGLYGGIKRGSVVVLSACNTGRGPVTSEGVEGMYRSFFAAGSATILVSLWYIDDKGTFDMMNRLYDNLKQGLSLHKSLRYAMLSVLGKGPMQDSSAGMKGYENVENTSVGMSPAFWAGFTVVGCESFLSA